MARLLAVAALALTGCIAHPYTEPAGPRYAGAADAASDEGERIVVVTFNIERAARIPEAIATIESDPMLRELDILLLQEMDAPGTEAIARALDLSYVYYPASVLGGRDFGNAVLSRWPIVDDAKIVLPHVSPLNQQTRIAVRALIDAPRGPLLVYSLHLETALLSLRGRRDQVRRVLDDAARFGHLPCVIAGDLNTAEPESVRSFVEDHRVLGFRWATGGVAATADYPFGSLVLDHVFVRDLVPLGAGAVPTDASDHRPVWVTLRRR